MKNKKRAYSPNIEWFCKDYVYKITTTEGSDSILLEIKRRITTKNEYETSIEIPVSGIESLVHYLDYLKK